MGEKVGKRREGNPSHLSLVNQNFSISDRKEGKKGEGFGYKCAHNAQ